MNDERKLTVLKCVTLGVGFGSLIIAGQSISRLFKKWKVVREAKFLEDKLKTTLKIPLPTTTVISQHSEWDQVHEVLSK